MLRACCNHSFSTQAISALAKMDSKFDLKLIPEFDRSATSLSIVEWVEKVEPIWRMCSLKWSTFSLWGYQQECLLSTNKSMRRRWIQKELKLPCIQHLWSCTLWSCQTEWNSFFLHHPEWTLTIDWLAAGMSMGNLERWDNWYGFDSSMNNKWNKRCPPWKFMQ